MELQINGIYPKLARAVEIAAVGGIRINIFANKEYKNARSDFDVIETFYDPIYRFYEKHSYFINIEISKPTYERIYNKYENINDISKRTAIALRNKKPGFELCKASNALLKTAIDKLELSLKQIQNIYVIAQTIAQLENCDKIKPEYVGEAIQYSIDITDRELYRVY